MNCQQSWPTPAVQRCPPNVEGGSRRVQGCIVHCAKSELVKRWEELHVLFSPKEDKRDAPTVVRAIHLMTSHHFIP